MVMRMLEGRSRRDMLMVVVMMEVVVVLFVCWEGGISLCGILDYCAVIASRGAKG